jgi:TRAP-type C4-dicarboxylate transport system substrate-binding protein
MVCVIGGTVFRKAALDPLPQDLRGAFMDIQGKVGQALTKMVRKDDESAYDRISKKMLVTELGPEDKEAWTALTRESVKRLAVSTFPRTLIEKVASLAGRPL